MVSASTFGRRVVALVLSWICVALILVGAILLTTDRLVGTPQRFAATVLATVSTPSVDQSLAVSAVNEDASHSNLAIRKVMQQHRGVLVAAFVRTMKSAAVVAEARSVVVRLYRNAIRKHPQVVNLRPLIIQFTSPWHDAFPRVRRVPGGMASQINVNAKGLKTIGSISRSWGKLAWLELLAGLLGAVLIARFLIRGHRKQLWSVGTIVGEPAVGLLVIGELGHHAFSVIHLGSNTGRILVASVVSRVAGALVEMALLLLACDVAILLIWHLLTVYGRRHGATTASISSRSL